MSTNYRPEIVAFLEAHCDTHKFSDYTRVGSEDELNARFATPLAIIVKRGNQADVLLTDAKYTKVKGELMISNALYTEYEIDADQHASPVRCEQGHLRSGTIKNYQIPNDFLFTPIFVCTRKQRP